MMNISEFLQNFQQICYKYRYLSWLKKKKKVKKLRKMLEYHTYVDLVTTGITGANSYTELI